MVGIAAAEVRQEVIATTGCSALEGIVLSRCQALVLPPSGVQVVHFDGHIVGVIVPGAEDDSFLLRPSGFQQVVEPGSGTSPIPVQELTGLLQTMLLRT